ncbi:MAG: HPr family phosphocarrier protein [Lachnospiraceae bacterium]|nr:HPr family phosphocarrier protein [Lachnospiraceae bacterium]
MMEKSIRLQLDGQLEARPIAMLVQVASQYDSTVYLETEGRKVNAKSIMGMMSLASSLGTEIRIITDGSDEEQAMAGMEAYLSNPEGK